MESWVTASIIVASFLWLQSEANPESFQSQNPFLRQWQLGAQDQVALPHSASGLHNQLNAGTIDFSTRRNSENANKENNFKQGGAKFAFEPATDRYAVEEEPEEHGAGYHDRKASQTIHMFEPRQLEIADDDQFYGIVPQHDVSQFQSHGHEKHGEVHYHQHKHVHKHEHKQEHKHQHKNEHKHDHHHKQEHKHSHHAGHKHGHNHKHDHHQDHKHDHHNEHKHSHHHNHKHGHHHGHKHEHHSHSKHQHHHGHKHGHKHGHQHKHKHQHSKHG